MATYTKQHLSASIDGKQIPINQVTSGSAVPIHTAVASSTALDEIYLYAYNDNTASIQLSILWGGTVEPDDVMRVSIPFKAGRTLIVDGKLLQNGQTVKAYATMTGSINIDGFVNNIAP